VELFALLSSKGKAPTEANAPIQQNAPKAGANLDHIKTPEDVLANLKSLCSSEASHNLLRDFIQNVRVNEATIFRW